MPELPEVETVCRGLSKAIKGKRITAVTIRRRDLRATIPRDFAKIFTGCRITSIHRRAKYIVLDTDAQNKDKPMSMLIHLGMSGRMVVGEKPTRYDTHDHVIFQMGDNTTVRFNDPRRFGLCVMAPTGEVENSPWLKNLGPEPLSDAFTADYLTAALRNKKTAVKIAIMDQTIVVGVGNIYASEALYRAGIKPSRKAGTIKRTEVEKLVPAIKTVLKEAIQAGGSSLRDYVQADGELGYFQHRFAVYDREGQKCGKCDCDIKNTGGVRRITQGGRSSFYCGQKQL